MDPKMALLQLFEPSLRGRAEKAALEFERPDGARIACTFGELERRSNRLAAALLARGLKQGDRLAVFLPNRVELIDLWLAGVKLGLILLPINILYRERELRHILADAEPRAVVTSAELAAFISGAERWDIEQLAAEAAGRSGERMAGAGAPEDPVALIYTSGTTGASKGAVLTQGNFAANASSLVAAWRITESDRYLCTLPLFHVHGLANGIHCWLLSGCHMRLTERFEHAKAAAWFEDYRPTLFFGVPAMFVRLLELPPETARAIGAVLRLAVSGSAPLPAEIHARFREAFGSVVLERYGMTETLMNTSNPYDGERRAGTVGRPLSHVAVRILNEDGSPAAEGATGELWVRGPNVCAGYWRRREATEAAWREGWFRTGDLGCRSADGYISLQGRRSDLIITGGFNIYPREIEEILLEEPGIREAAVVGAPDPVRGEVPVAYVVADCPPDEGALRRRLATQLASFKIPRAFVRVDALPRTALGKVQKHLLPPRRPAA
jgi:malonyl-CoA/methylmalonyl-CoA synthetase